jgi:hypothetical protein
MSKYHKAFASFLARTFCPVTVSFKSSPLIYSNLLFSVSHKLDMSNRATGKNSDYITFDYALNKYDNKYSINKLNTPESFIKYILDKPTNTSFEVTKKDNDIYEFNTNGNIPLRYIDMINDFSPYEFSYIKPTPMDIKLYETKLFEKILNINDNMLIDIYKYACYISEKEKYIKIEVTKAPSYPLDDEFIKNYNYGTFRMDESTEYLYKNIAERVWKSGDGDFSSPSTKIFLNRSKYYKSITHKNIGYQKLFSASGGINFSYVRYLPWFQLKQKMNDIQPYYYVSGQNVYYSYIDNIGLTEFVIFCEVLCKEGAVLIYHHKPS